MAMAKAKYNLVTTTRTTTGAKSRYVNPLGSVDTDGMEDVILAWCIIDYSNALMKKLKSEGYKVAKIEDHQDFQWRKITLSDGTTMTITTQAA